MSQSELERFVADVKENKELQEALKKVGAEADKIAAFAKEKGYDFSADELKSFVDAKKSELSEEQLEKVAGGFAAGIVEVVAVAVAVAS